MGDGKKKKQQQQQTYNIQHEDMSLAKLGHIFNTLVAMIYVRKETPSCLPMSDVFDVPELEVEKYRRQALQGFCFNVPSLKLTCPLKRDYFSREYIFQPFIFRGHVSFAGEYLFLLLFIGGFLR